MVTTTRGALNDIATSQVYVRLAALRVNNRQVSFELSCSFSIRDLYLLVTVTRKNIAVIIIIIIIMPRQCLWCWCHDSKSLREFTRFTRWMQNSARWPLTLGPSRWTWAIGPPVGGYRNYIHRRHLLILLSPKADTHFTIPQRVE